jgi:dTMP kinase
MDTFFAARMIHLLAKIYPAIQTGRNAASDRLDPSTYVYQKVHSISDKGEDLFNSELEKRFFDHRNRILTIEPDAYFFLDVDPEEGMRRRAADKNQESNHFDLAGIKEQERRRRSYQVFFEKIASPNTKCITIDANEPIHIVAQNVLKEVTAIFNS